MLSFFSLILLLDFEGVRSIISFCFGVVGIDPLGTEVCSYSVLFLFFESLVEVLEWLFFEGVVKFNMHCFNALLFSFVDTAYFDCSLIELGVRDFFEDEYCGVLDSFVDLL